MMGLVSSHLELGLICLSPHTSLIPSIRSILQGTWQYPNIPLVENRWSKYCDTWGNPTRCINVSRWTRGLCHPQGHESKLLLRCKSRSRGVRAACCCPRTYHVLYDFVLAVLPLHFQQVVAEVKEVEASLLSEENDDGAARPVQTVSKALPERDRTGDVQGRIVPQDTRHPRPSLLAQRAVHGSRKSMEQPERGSAQMRPGGLGSRRREVLACLCQCPPVLTLGKSLHLHSHLPSYQPVWTASSWRQGQAVFVHSAQTLP